MNYIILASALLPAVILLFYIYFKDRNNPEPIGKLIAAFWWGVFSLFLSLTISMPLMALGVFTDEPKNVIDAISLAFLGAAIPEECAKLFVLWLFLRKNKYFDENVDGIVYAVCVSLGFAALENVMYLFGNHEHWMSVGAMRALCSVPGHMFFGILMGYYYSFLAFQENPSMKHKILVIGAPVLAHGLFNSMLMSLKVTPSAISGLLMILFIVFVVRMWFYGRKRIREHLKRDGVE